MKWFYNLKVMENFYKCNRKLHHLLLYQIYKCHNSIGLWCQFCRSSIISILSPHHHIRYLVLNLIGPWCQFCRHIITSGILFWLKLLRFISNLSEPKKTLKSLFPTLHCGQKYWELLIIEGRFVIIKRLRQKSQQIIGRLYL